MTPLEDRVSIATLVNTANDRFRRGLTHRTWWVRGFSVLALCLLLGAPVGAVLGLLGWMYGTAALVALIVAYWILRSTLVGLLSTIAIITLLPFAALPFDVGFTPTFLDLALAGLYLVWLSRIMARRDTRFVSTPTTLPLASYTFAPSLFTNAEAQTAASGWTSAGAETGLSLRSAANM